MYASDKLALNISRGMKFGTGTTRALLDRLGSPDLSLKTVHIAGTNGKGSVAEFMTEILLAAGRRVGTFTSPEVFEYNDMFRVDNKPLTDGPLRRYLDEALAAAEGLDATAFEVETAAALYAFCREGCEYAVVECGMGGDTDATNAVLRKEVAVITSVSLEHTAFLGGSVREICARKAGIVRDCPVVVESLQTEEGMAYLSHIDGAIVAKTPENVRIDRGFACFDLSGKQFNLTCAGGVQAYNAATAIEAARVLKIDENAIYCGVNRAKPRGRLQVFERDGRKYVLDGAHNPAAFEPLADFLRGEEGEKSIIFGCLSDKDAPGCMSALSGIADGVTVVVPKSPRAMDGNKIAAACRKYFKRVERSDGVCGALAAARGDIVIVCGSFTLLKEAREWIERG